MDEFLDSLARRLGVAPLSEEEISLLLDVTRDVAHASQRRHAPLTAFLVGQALAAGPGDRTQAMTAAISVIRAALPTGQDASDQPER